MTSIDLELRENVSRAQTFGALSDPVRLRILDILGPDERCVRDLQESIEIAPNLLSYHLRVLREAALVTATRRGRWIDYRIAEGATFLIGDAFPPTLTAGPE